MLSKKTIQHINKLEQKKVRREENEFVVEGVKSVKEALVNKANILFLVIENERREENELEEIVKLTDKKKILVEFCSSKEVKEIKSTDTFPGVLAVIKQAKASLNDLNGTIICLDGVKDPGNLGTIIRTADWFGVKSILLSEDCVDLYNPKVVRSTMGSIFHLNILESTNFVQDLKQLQKNGYLLNGLVMNGENLNKMKAGKNQVYILGSESHGIRPEVEKILNNKYTIQGCPSAGSGQAESLNVAVAAGILLSKI